MKLKTTHPLLSIFLTAGYPKLNDLPLQLTLLEKYGVDFVEVGIPFSDPLADGPVIQESSTIALKNGMQLPLRFRWYLWATLIRFYNLEWIDFWQKQIM